MIEVLLSYAAPVSRQAFLTKIQSSILQLKENYTHHDQNQITESKSITAAQHCCLPKRWDNCWEAPFSK